MNRSAVTSPNPTPLPLRSINHRVFHFFYARSRTSKGNIEGLCTVSVYFTDKKEQNKAKDKYTETRRSNVVRKPKKKPQGLFLPKYYVQVRHLPQAVNDLGHYCWTSSCLQNQLKRQEMRTTEMRLRHDGRWGEREWRFLVSGVTHRSAMTLC